MVRLYWTTSTCILKGHTYTSKFTCVKQTPVQSDGECSIWTGFTGSCICINY